MSHSFAYESYMQRPAPVRGTFSKHSRMRPPSPPPPPEPEPPADPQAESSLFSLCGPLLEQVLLQLDLDDAQSARASCRAMRNVTLEPGFATLWRLAHPAHSRAKALLSSAAKAFEALDRTYVLETSTAPAPGSDWLPLSIYQQHEAEDEAGPSAGASWSDWSAPTPPARRKGKRSGRQMAAIGFDEEETMSMSLEARTRRFFEAVDAYRIESVVVEDDDEW